MELVDPQGPLPVVVLHDPTLNLARAFAYIYPTCSAYVVSLADHAAWHERNGHV